MSVAARIRKLLQRAQENTPEAATARRIAEQLMRQHGILEEEVAPVAAILTGDPIDPHRLALAGAVAAKLECTLFPGATIIFTGPGDLASRAARLYSALARQAALMSAIPPGYAHGLPKSALDAWRECYWIGFVAATANRLVPRKAAPSGASPAAEPSEKESLGKQAAERAFREISMLEIDLESFMAPVDARLIVEWLKDRAFKGGEHVGLNVSIEDPQPIRGFLSARAVPRPRGPSAQPARGSKPSASNQASRALRKRHRKG